MPFVLDASVTAAWYLPDELTPKALKARQRLSEDRGLVPPHWWYEICNTLLAAERRHRMSEHDTFLALSSLADLPLEGIELSDGASIFRIARRHRLTFYDAAYLELALREKIALATLDKDLANAAALEGVALVIAR
jgi:predicted nucleic acid-binding protein